MGSMILVFILLAVAVFALLSGVQESGEEARILRKRLSALDPVAADDIDAEVGLLRQDVTSSIPALNRILSKSTHISELQRWINQSGMQLLVGKFALMSACTGGILCILAEHFTGSGLLGVFAFAIGAAIPILIISLKRRQRFAAFEACFLMRSICWAAPCEPDTLLPRPWN